MVRRKTVVVFLLTLFLLATVPLVLGDTWSFNDVTELQNNLPAVYEPSGIVYHPLHDALFIVDDEGVLIQMGIDGSNVATWNVGGDLEGITVIPQSESVYIAVEKPYGILEVDTTNGAILSSISLVGVVPAVTSSNLGIEAITFVPNTFHPYPDSLNGGLFYIGIQENGKIHVVDVNFDDSSAELVSSFTPVSGRSDIAGLHFSEELETLYVLYDGAKKIREITTNNEFIIEHAAPGTAPEGITLISNCPSTNAQLFISEDGSVETGRRVLEYDNIPINCPVLDSDNDGVEDDVDVCPGFDDSSDLDTDGIPDGCDLVDDTDSDGDGVRDELDVCVGFDDSVDVDEDGTPDGCDSEVHLGDVDTVLIESIRTTRRGRVIIKYDDGTRDVINPFEGRRRVKAKTNTLRDRLVITNGEFVLLYNSGELIDSLKISDNPIRTSLRVKEKNEYDLIKVKLRNGKEKIRVKIALEDDELTLIS